MEAIDVENLFAWIPNLYSKWKNTELIQKIWLRELKSFSLSQVKQAVSNYYSTVDEYLTLPRLRGQLERDGAFRRDPEAVYQEGLESLRKRGISLPARPDRIERIMDNLGPGRVSEEMRKFCRENHVDVLNIKPGTKPAWVKKYEEKLAQLESEFLQEVPF